MKRKISLFLSIVIFLMSFTTININASSGENLRTESFFAYYQFLQNEINNLGKECTTKPFLDNLPPKSRYFSNSYGDVDYSKNRQWTNDKISCVYIKDLTGDGVEEMIYQKVMSAPKQDVPISNLGNYTIYESWTGVYSYINGNLTLIGQTADTNGATIYEEKTDIYYNDGIFGYNGADLYLCCGVNGDTTICCGEPAKLHLEESVIYYRYSNGTIKPDDRMNQVFLEWYETDTLNPHFGYFINGENVSEEQFKQKLQLLQGKEIIKLEDIGYNDALYVFDSMFPGYYYPSTWARETVQMATIDGYVPSRIKLKYTDAITREEFCEIATLFYEKYRGNIEIKNVSFSDTTNESVLKMASLGVVTGVGNNQFDPNSSLTREMAATILVRLAKSMKLPLKEGVPGFSDNSNISSWAYENVGVSQSSGIMNGNADGTFAPNNHYTREQAIVTVYRLKNLFVPVERLEIKENVSVIVDEKCAFPKVDIYPENATDLNLTFKTAKESIFICNNGEIQAIEEGTSQLIAISSNGVESKTTVTVTPKVFISPKPNLNTSLNVIEDTFDPIFRGSLPNGYDSFPNGETISSKVKVTGVKKLLRGNVEIIAMLSEITTGYDNEYAEYNQPYLKWKLLNESGKEIDNGLSLLRNLKKVGDQETIQLDFGDLPKGNYTLEFINLEGREFDLKEQEPKIIVKGLPLKLSSVGLVEGSETRDRSDDVTETFSAKLIDIECYFEYSKSDDMYYLSCDLIGESGNGSKWASQRISWTLTDSAGEEIDDGTETIHFEDEICIEDFIENYDLEPGETYYITIKAKKNTSYYEGVDYDCIIYD